MEKIIDFVIENFDFEKIHKTMTFLNWHWGSCHGIPSIGALVLQAKDLLEEVSKCEPGDSISTGGFKASKKGNEEEGLGLSLVFVLARSECFEGDLGEEE